MERKWGYADILARTHISHLANSAKSLQRPALNQDRLGILFCTRTNAKSASFVLFRDYAVISLIPSVYIFMLQMWQSPVKGQ